MSEKVFNPVSPEYQVSDHLLGVAKAINFPLKRLDSQAEELFASTVHSIFTDGEYPGVTAPESDSLLEDFFGRRSLYDGWAPMQLRQLYESGNRAYAHADMCNFMKEVAWKFAERAAAQDSPDPTVRVNRDEMTLEFDFAFDADTSELIVQTAIPLRLPPRKVVDYTPGLAGTIHIDQQVEGIRRAMAEKRGLGVYEYVAITDGPYVGDFLQAYFRHKLEKFVPPEAIEPLQRFYLNLPNGIARGSEEFNYQHNGRSSVDVVLAADIHAAGERECRFAIINAHRLLRTGGALFLRAPATSKYLPEGSVNAEDMYYMALDAGFLESDVVGTETSMVNDTGETIDVWSHVFYK